MSTPNRAPPTDEGASPKELLFEACRRNNIELLTDVFKPITGVDNLANFLNTSTDALGNTAAHVAAQYGSYHALDHLLDQEGFEVDPLDKLEKETPLHKAVKYANYKDQQVGAEVVELLLDAGADPRILNKGKQRAVDLVDPRNKALREMLQKAEYAIANAGDVVNMDDNDDDVGHGSASDSE
ncbi:ankyrin [Terfezia boudieri ATCC MYA-4762]|uniref:Ankyrin n=1 Tax=Terfezia boudieri ATCC MYA-4762 TaxID=1051890 RepID=A0A3N4LGB8_9PEZI|nr:ankyrin [Terfezia boudieri ATCC MYA-4762]